MGPLNSDNSTVAALGSDGGYRKQPAGPTVQVILTRHIQLAQSVHGVKRRPDAESIGVPRLGQLDQAGGRVNAFDPLIGIGPVPEPVAVQQQVRFSHPAGGSVARINELTSFTPLPIISLGPILHRHVGDPQEALIGSTRQLHRFPVEKQFMRRMRLEPVPAGESPELKRNEIRHPVGLQVNLPHLRPDTLRQALQSRGVLHRFPSFQPHSPPEYRPFTGRGAKYHRGRFGPGILF